jgi:hypothetical protein
MKRPIPLLLVPALIALSGCLYKVREATDKTVRDAAARPYDMMPAAMLASPPPAATGQDKSGTPPAPQKKGSDDGKKSELPAYDVQTTAVMEVADPPQPGVGFQLTVPQAIPGSEAPLLKLPPDVAGQREVLRKLYTPLAPLQEEVQPLPGPNGKPYTLSDLQRIAAENSAELRQASSDVQAARGAMIQAATYQNPVVGVGVQPSNDNSTAGAFGLQFNQNISMGGKMKLNTAAALRRTDLLEVTTETVTENMLVGVMLVVVILFMFVSNIKTAIIVAINIPLALLFAFTMLFVRDKSANLLSIGAVDFGIIVDSSVIMVENI